MPKDTSFFETAKAIVGARYSAPFIEALAQIDRAFAGHKGPGPVVPLPYREPERPPRYVVDEALATRNRERFAQWVESRLTFARQREPKAAAEWLMGFAESLKADLDQIGPGCVARLVGLDAALIANARDRLAAAAGSYSSPSREKEGG